MGLSNGEHSGLIEFWNARVPRLKAKKGGLDQVFSDLPKHWLGDYVERYKNQGKGQPVLLKPLAFSMDYRPYKNDFEHTDFRPRLLARIQGPPLVNEAGRRMLMPVPTWQSLVELRDLNPDKASTLKQQLEVRLPGFGGCVNVSLPTEADRILREQQVPQVAQFFAGFFKEIGQRTAAAAATK
jgi:hypothetical protein